MSVLSPVLFVLDGHTKGLQAGPPGSHLLSRNRQSDVAWPTRPMRGDNALALLEAFRIEEDERRVVTRLQETGFVKGGSQGQTQSLDIKLGDSIQVLDVQDSFGKAGDLGHRVS